MGSAKVIQGVVSARGESLESRHVTNLGDTTGEVEHVPKICCLSNIAKEVVDKSKLFTIDPYNTPGSDLDSPHNSLKSTKISILSPIMSSSNMNQISNNKINSKKLKHFNHSSSARINSIIPRENNNNNDKTNLILNNSNYQQKLIDVDSPIHRRSYRDSAIPEAPSPSIEDQITKEDNVAGQVAGVTEKSFSCCQDERREEKKSWDEVLENFTEQCAEERAVARYWKNEEKILNIEIQADQNLVS